MQNDKRQDFMNALSAYPTTPQAKELALAVATFETGNFKSSLFLNANNPFGMRPPKSRKNHTGATASGFAIFPNYSSAVKDFFERLKSFGQNPAPGWQSDRAYIDRFVRSYLGTDASQTNVKNYSDYLQRFNAAAPATAVLPARSDDSPPPWFIPAMLAVGAAVYFFIKNRPKK